MPQVKDGTACSSAGGGVRMFIGDDEQSPSNAQSLVAPPLLPKKKWRQALRMLMFTLADSE
jgi:hypothetical protein